jgi:hypothetical protein
MGFMEIIFKHRSFVVDAAPAIGATILISGALIRRAEIKDEEWLADVALADPAAILTALAKSPVRADLLTFSQKLPDTTPKHCYPFEWDNVAAIHTARFEDWWNGLPQEARKNCRRAARRGVVVRTMALTDDLIRAVMEIYNETPVRQGRPFAHYAKNFATVKREISTLPDTSEFLGAFFGEELIGFIKLVRLGEIASILHIVTKNKHYDKRPANALVTAAAERCRDTGIAFLTYGKLTYGNKTESPLGEFKRRMGFEKIPMPRYFVPLTLRGRVFTRLKLHRGLIGLLPAGLLQLLLSIRAWWVQNVWAPSRLMLKSRGPRRIRRNRQSGEC